jgi:hypothetical protein
MSGGVRICSVEKLVIDVLNLNLIMGSIGTTSSLSMDWRIHISKSRQVMSSITKPRQTVNFSAFPRSRYAVIPMPLTVDVAKLVSNESSERKESGDGKYVFLEIARATEPIGLVLTTAGDGTYKRIGYFYMGRRDLPEEEEKDGGWTPGEREADWNKNLEIRAATIV